MNSSAASQHEVSEEVLKNAQFIQAVRDQVATVVVGQDEVVERLLISLFTGGHILLQGVPGLAKTLLVSVLSKSIDLDFSRIQFTIDLLPSDILGSQILDQKTNEFVTRTGPIFTNLLLADEINRAAPKVQGALLEAMQERKVTLDGETHALSDNFMVVATQNPIENQGVYPLPEAQLDRFAFKLLVDYPSAEEEVAIVKRFGERAGPQGPLDFGIERVANAGTISQAQEAVKQVVLADDVIGYTVALVRATRDNPDIASGASPRAAVLLANAARARAALAGRAYVIPDDVKALATACLRHRLLLSPAAEIEGKQVEELVAGLIEQTEAPR